MNKWNAEDVEFIEVDEYQNGFNMGFAWGCAASAGLCLIVVALAAAFGG